MTDQPIIPRRSVLFMPAANERALEKAKTLACDAIIFDLEDAVAPAMKGDARDKAAAAVASGAYGRRERILRINGLETAWWKEDVLAAAGARPDAVLIPKVESAAAIQQVAAVMDAAGASSIKIWAMLETPMAYLRAEEIAAASDKVTCFVIGTNDLVKDLHAKHTKNREPVITALGMAMLVARAYKLTILDGVYNDFRNTEGLAVECQQAADMGFDGKTLIHPAQIDIANDVFAPDEGAIRQAEKLIAAFDEAKAEGLSLI
ncbi:MAG: CoA ester lyase, partial [Kordiimonadaceae bacterium]|nr:CoA ester lyase [Kordiimonadaceae bacterium]